VAAATDATSRSNSARLGRIPTSTAGFLFAKIIVYFPAFEEEKTLP
jgi:hypothetical protein